MVDVINNRDKLWKFLLAVSDISILENLNAIVSNGSLNSAVVRHVLDTADKSVLAKLNPLHVALKDVKQFDAQNPVLQNLLAQIEGSKLSDEEIKKTARKNKR